MRTHLIAVGRMKAGPERALFDHYAGRLSEPPKLHEVEEKRSLPSDKRKASEASLLLGRVPDGAIVVAMDERGKTVSSVAFAQKIGAWQDEGFRDIAFLIGGADGLDKTVRQKAHLTLSLGDMTWPHMLVRGLLAEQIYRAHAILSGHPYHRE